MYTQYKNRVEAFKHNKLMQNWKRVKKIRKNIANKQITVFRFRIDFMNFIGGKTIEFIRHFAD